MAEESILCKICGKPSKFIGIKKGKKHDFLIFQCESCYFSFIKNPLTNYVKIYDESYYNGQGYDEYVDYVFEMKRPDKTIREYEWRGILKIISNLSRLSDSTKWLDFGCGNGGLVKYVHNHTDVKIVGFEEGYIKNVVVSSGIPILNRNQLRKHKFDIITAIEVLEYVPDPIKELRLIYSLLKPGGIFFYTTGNSRPYRNKLLNWRYVIPEIHMSFFEPGTMTIALNKANFIPKQIGFLPGFSDIIRFKVLKNLNIRKKNLFERIIPWTIISRLIDIRYGVSRHPVAFKPKWQLN